jgi:hypothetical protein
MGRAARRKVQCGIRSSHQVDLRRGASYKETTEAPHALVLLHCSFFAGAFLANGIPHLVQGMCGNKFQSPFASPPGMGESSAIVNVIWGWFNFIVGGTLLRIFLPPLPPPAGSLVAIALGVLVLSLGLAIHFGKVRTTAPNP